MSIEELVIEIQKGNAGLKNELWERIRKWAAVLCRRYAEYGGKMGCEMEDLINVSWFGVERAIKAYDPDKPYKFITYMKFNVQNAISELLGLRGRKRLPELSLDEPLGGEDEDTTRLDMLEDKTAGEAFESVEQRELCGWVREQVEELRPDLREIIHGKYWQGMTCAELGRRIGASSDRVRQLEATALGKIRQRPEMREYYNAFCYRRVGVNSFNTTWTSSTEWAVLKLEQMRERERENEKRIIAQIQQEKTGEMSGENMDCREYRILESEL